MAKASLTIRVRVAWWLVPAIYVYAFTCKITGATPDFSVIDRAIERAVRLEAK